MNEENIVLRANNISAGYGEQIIIRNINLNLYESSIKTIIGPNGCGKSTFLKSISGIINPVEGNIDIFGEDVTELNTFELSKIGLGYVPQSENIFPSLSVEDNLKMGGYILNSEEYKNNLEKVLEMFPDLRDKLSDSSSNLSGGQRQMLALSRALMLDPKIIMLDEPTAGLSPIIVDEVLENIISLKKSRLSVLLVEQNARKALSVSDYGVVFSFGEKVMEDDAYKILSDKEISKLYLGG
ncbi:ABC transporter ATP-binding protein [Chloroflexi bacterium]|jgi:ABC-type branched-subunit amino acid transport system ATPase component|nr:ABC transporter ATP-binding protein [Chloroflexota bacterium]MDC0252782.1 ABC transporter ATP-binding protein [Chloroflexota bacterium]RZP12604.1 MAG: ABC transporter ATP-binding protein [Chloroflexota bacterium]|tara:strand:+ start:2678 stop:3397 length:720 start_codon:yes stop_codon:yes gene_type:complete